ncbi:MULTISPECIES: FAD-dependent oxidoreductase [unclassified Halanaerobium]|uniref:FAD-dependent oxidoreductase n=1 Tax=unclassified Halanaerobium TaxID=2641197 RepID=UPI000DF41E05|nr:MULTISPECIES: FAD-dependent oxidoreductase [unclassified Halanaerobium]RCW44402.1 NADPH-dependent 2,4-dienoyl-CoA reductase/sulfur reductase-like enzyme [Halanaerobium sp. MA284_MarDTE_T2]RCW86539.1 NADPH-dependent 2,4-dienoyl-CoA reductase/sulfur reductase-like enzyme [Halanaerobium sp. DL-01]
MEKEVVIIGGSDLGISTALRIRELNKNIKPLVITNNNFPNFSICGIPFYISGEVKCWQNLAHRKEDDIRNKGIELLLNTEVTNINHQEKYILIKEKDKKDNRKKIFYNKLVLGTGGKNIIPKIEGLGLPGVFFMRWMEDAINFNRYLESNKVKDALIIGGGYVGLEMAEALVKRGLNVTIVEFFDNVLTTVNRNFRDMVKNELEKNGVKVITSTAVKKIEKEGDKLIVTGNNSLKEKVDTIAASVGTEANTKLGKDIGLKRGIKGAYKVNRKMQTSIEDIYAGGDCAETLNNITDKYTYYALGTVAHKHGRIIGDNICGLDKEFAGVIGTQSIKLFDLVIARTGLSEEEAVKNGFNVKTKLLESWDHKVYYPPVYKMYTEVIIDSDSRRILGAQIMGNKNAEIAKRIDIFAAAIFNKMKTNDFNQLDLSYTPPLSSPWDPVQMAVQEIEK